MFNHPLALELAYIAVEESVRLGATYADARYEMRQHEEVCTQNGRLAQATLDVERGLGIRVLYRGAWGYCGISEPNRHDVAVAAKRAVKLAQAAAVLQHRPATLASESSQRAVYRTTIKRDPLAVPLEDKVSLLLDIDERLRKVDGVIWADGRISALRQRKIFVSSEGSEIDQELVSTGAGYRAGALGEDGMQFRSFTGGPGGLFMGRGWETIAELNLEEGAEQVATEAVQLSTAQTCPTEKTDLILDGALMAHHLLNTAGPLFELDRVLRRAGDRAVFSVERLGADQVASSLVDIYSDASEEGSAGSMAYDDEGVQSHRVELLEAGKVAGYLSSRETAARVGLERSSGSVRASGWFSAPTVRPSNIGLAPRDGGSLEDLIADTESGIVLSNPRVVTLHGGGKSFFVVAEAGWRIQNGQRQEMLKNPSYSGDTIKFWSTCDAVGGPESWQSYGSFARAKATDESAVPVGAGAPPVRFKDVDVRASTFVPPEQTSVSFGDDEPAVAPTKRPARKTKRRSKKSRSRKKDTK